MLIAELKEKFRTSGLDHSDCGHILQLISITDEYSDLISLIYMFGYSYPEHRRVLQICDKYINEPVPGLTAVCMRVAVDYWGHWSSYTHAFERFLDLSIYDEWYDEVIFTALYVKKNPHLPFPKPIIDRFNKLISHPRIIEMVPLEDLP